MSSAVSLPFLQFVNSLKSAVCSPATGKFVKLIVSACSTIKGREKFVDVLSAFEAKHRDLLTSFTIKDGVPDLSPFMKVDESGNRLSVQHDGKDNLLIGLMVTELVMHKGMLSALTFLKGFFTCLASLNEEMCLPYQRTAAEIELFLNPFKGDEGTQTKPLVSPPPLPPAFMDAVSGIAQKMQGKDLSQILQAAPEMIANLVAQVQGAQASASSTPPPVALPAQITDV